MTYRNLASTTALLAIAAALPAAPAMAQDYGGYGADDEVTSSRDGREVRSGERVVEVSPYIEASQVLVAELSPGDEVLTYTQVAVGVDASVQGRNNGGSVSLRYERNFAGNDGALDSDTISGVARGYASVVPQTLTVEAGALAARTRVDGNGSSTLNPVVDVDSESQIYSVYAGPNLHTQAGDVHINANYRIGYTRVESPDAIVTAPGADPVDVFDDSLSQAASVHVATQAGEPLPVGVGVGAGWAQEDIDNLDQRVVDRYVRGDITVPLGPTLALVGGVGYEDVEVSSRDAVRDANGDPVFGPDGRFVTDTSQPRQIAFETDGLIWDVGVVWRPSSRTTLEAHVGRRYDSTTYYGSFAWAPDNRSSLHVSVYDGLSGFGGLINNALVNLPTEFDATRNPLTGDINGCVASLDGNNCLTGALGSIRSSVFRSRGVAASYSRQVGRISAGVGAGYDRRKFIAGPGTALAAADGLVDENYYVVGFVSAELDRNSGISTNAYANWSETDFIADGGTSAYGASAAYRRNIIAGLSARAAVAIDHFESDVSDEDLTAASALLGLRYDF